mmetsp:Transcript_36704/g.56267  ORF Transcript_36704/g.56267 Transcript_36704/m.56267 type:complete len:94 (-) Transcript_36704:710-991(-)
MAVRKDEPRKEHLDNFMRCALLCHDVLRINDKLSGASQDELVLLQYIEDNHDSKLISRDSDSITISINGQHEVYKILKVFEFSSERKMMSVSV